MSITIALAGNPNSGKTTMFNALTGSSQYVGNWPGVTVEKKEGRLKGDKTITVTDLPGVYSLSPYTLEEVVARDYLIGERPSVIVDLVDATNIERNLYLTTQLIEVGIPVVVALNMMDIIRKNSGTSINVKELSKRLGCPVVETSALKSSGLQEVIAEAKSAAGSGSAPTCAKFAPEVETALAELESIVTGKVAAGTERYHAIKLFERDEKVLAALTLSPAEREQAEKLTKNLETEYDDDAESIITGERYAFIGEVMSKCVSKKPMRMTTSDKIDRIVTNRILALPIFALVMWAVYTLSIGTIGDWTVVFMNDGLFGSFAETYPDSFLGSWLSIPELLDLVLLDSAGEPVIAEWLYSLIQDGIVGGVGAVLGFVPQMLILFLLLSILEDIGYMARIAFIMDRIFRKFGLSGKSFIPMLISSGCGVPGIMASRTIEQDRDRRMTIMTTGFIPCGAKMPIVGLIAGAVFGGAGWVATAVYFIGVAAVILSGILLKKFKAFAGDPVPFVMELPAYHIPAVGNVLRATWERGWSFIKRAGTVIVAASVVIWVLNSLSFDGGFHYITDENGGASILEVIGSGIAVLFRPLGFGQGENGWMSAVATVLGLVAKEEVVGVFGSLTSMADADLAMGLAETMDTALAVIGTEVFGGSALKGLSFLIFNLLCAPCFAAMGAIKREMNSPKWTAIAIGYMCVFAYAISLIVYQLGALFTGGGFGIGTVCGIVTLLALVYLLVRPNRYAKMGGGQSSVEATAVSSGR